MSFLTRTYPFKQSKHLLKDSSIFGFIIWVILYFLQPFVTTQHPYRKLLVNKA